MRANSVRKRMETVDDEILANALKFVDKARQDGKPFFLWLNPTRMHVITHLSEKYQKMRTPENGWTIEEGGMAQLDDIVGSVKGPGTSRQSIGSGQRIINCPMRTNFVTSISSKL